MVISPQESASSLSGQEQKLTPRPACLLSNLIGDEGRRWPFVALILFIGAFAIRVWGVNWSLPAVIHHDEMNIGRAALGALVSGELVPKFYYHPMLAILVHSLAAIAAFLIGAFNGLYGSIAELRLADYLPLARAFSALCGALTVVVVAHTARCVRKEATILAALIASTGFISVLHGHYATPDAPLVLLIQLALLLSLRAVQTESWGRLFWAGAFAGAAASFKYTGAIALIPVSVAAVMMSRSGRLRRASMVVLVGIGVFIALNIPALLDFGDLVEHVRFEAFHYFEAGNLGAANLVSENPGGLLFHIRAVLGDVGYMAGAFAILGLLGALSSSVGRRYALLILCFVAPHLALFASAKAAFPRNVLPITPIIAVLAGIGLVHAAQALQEGSLRPKIVFLATFFVIMLPLRAALLNDYLMTRKSTLAKTQEFLLANGERLAGRGFGVASLHSLWTPRTIGGKEVSIGEMFLRGSADGTRLVKPEWFVEEGFRVFTLESWGLRRYGGFEWPARLIALVQRYCVKVYEAPGWPPEPCWFPSHSFSAPKIDARTCFGPTIEVYLLRSGGSTRRQR
ncbi:glycosyltransferase family 39 protein [bacterium]|nr:glycosyltransferase family 39 protein [bacterium]